MTLDRRSLTLSVHGATSYDAAYCRRGAVYDVQFKRNLRHKCTRNLEEEFMLLKK